MKKTLLFALGCVSLVACNNTEVKEGNNTEKEITVDNTNTQEDVVIENSIVYAIPSPNEQIEMLKYTGGESSESLVHDISKVDDYTTSGAKAMNFGIYSTDAGYLACFGNTSNFMKYLSVLENLGNDLGISSVYNEALMAKAESFQNQPDSLFQLSSENYMSIFDKMIQNEKGAELGLILTGGWVETMHIMTASAGDYNQNPDMQELILTQSLVLENLIGFLNEYNTNSDIDNVLSDLSKFETLFQQVDCNDEQTEVTSIDGVQVLSGGQSCEMSEGVYSALREEVSKLRQQITQN